MIRIVAQGHNVFYCEWILLLLRIQRIDSVRRSDTFGCLGSSKEILTEFPEVVLCGGGFLRSDKFTHTVLVIRGDSILLGRIYEHLNVFVGFFQSKRHFVVRNNQTQLVLQMLTNQSQLQRILPALLLPTFALVLLLIYE